MKLRNLAAAGLILSTFFTGGCGRVQARQAFKDGNKLYKDENYKKAIEAYERALKLNPEMPDAEFYLGSAHQAMFRPGKDTPDNKGHLEQAIAHYEASLAANNGSSANLRKVKQNTLAALVGIHSEEPYRKYEKAHGYAEQLVSENPNDARNLYAMANLFEKFEKVDEAEKLYTQVYEANPAESDPKKASENKQRACNALAAFFNKALWGGKSRFDDAIRIISACADLVPEDSTDVGKAAKAAAYHKVATFYWDKAFRDPMLDDNAKTTYADKGLEYEERALKVKSDYWEGFVYKGLLLRVKASVERSPKLQKQYLEEATAMAKQGMELRKEQVPVPGASGLTLPGLTGGAKPPAPGK